MKPYMGVLTEWAEVDVPSQEGLGYVITCRFRDHPYFAGMRGHTSMVIKSELNPDGTYSIETRNSRYTLAAQVEE